MASVLFYSLVTGLILLSILVPLQETDCDLWGKIAIGAILSETGSLPMRDYFSFTANGHPWVDHEWLSGVIYFSLLDLFGEPGLMLFKYGLLVGMMFLIGLLHKYGYRRSAVWSAYFFGATFPIYSYLFLTTARSQLFSFLGFVCTLVLLECIRCGALSRRYLLALVPLFLFWGNAHAGFMVGLIVLFLFGIGSYVRGRLTESELPLDGSSLEARRDGLVLMGLSGGLLLLIGLLNPYGWDFLEMIWTGLTLDRFLIAEWNPVPLWSLDFWQTKLLFLLAMAAIIARGIVEWRQGKSWNECSVIRQLGPVLVLVATFLMTLKAVRFQAFFMLSLVTFLPLLVPAAAFDWVKKMPQPHFRWLKPAALYWLPGLMAVSALLRLPDIPEERFLKSVVPSEQQTISKFQGNYPVGAVAFLMNSPYSGNLVTSFPQGQFIMWALYPRFRISMDARYEAVYTQDQMLENVLFYNADEAHLLQPRANYLREIGADFVLFSRFDRGADALLKLNGWQLIYQDRYYAVITRLPMKRGHAPLIVSGTTGREYTIGDFFNEDDLRRFQSYPVGGAE